MISAVPVFCAGVLWPQFAAAAVAVEINDGSGGVLCSGSLVNMSTTTNQVTVGMDGNCGSGVGNLGSSQISMGSVDEGSSTSTIILDGVTFTPPVTVQVDANNSPMSGSAVTLHALSDMTYSVSYAAAFVDADTNDSFGVNITDSSDQSATMIFNVTVKAVVASESSCSPTATIVCKGDLDLATNGERYYVPIDLNTTQVWTITPDKRAVFEKFSFRYLTNVMTVSISENYNVDSQREYCTVQVASGSLYLNETATWGQCHVQPDVTYFLRVSSPSSGSYSFFY